jgi:hypothetical protein
MPRRDSFVLQFANSVVAACERISFFYWIARLWGDPSYRFVDCWVLSWVSAAALAYFSSFLYESSYLQAAIVLISAIRIIEMLVYHAKILIFDQYRAGTKNYSVRSYRRILILLALNYVEIILWFGTYYSFLVISQKMSVIGPAPISILRESIGLMVANSSGVFALDKTMSRLTWLTVTAHAAIGLIMTTIVITRFISLLPPPPSQDLEEKNP